MSTCRAARLLLADDDLNSIESSALYFAGHGLEVRTAANGIEALAAYRAWKPDAVLLDIEMPLLDGRAVARQIRRDEHGSHVLLIAISGLSALSESLASTSAGFNYHVEKPANLRTILDTVLLHCRTGKAVGAPADESDADAWKAAEGNQDSCSPAIL